MSIRNNEKERKTKGKRYDGLYLEKTLLLNFMDNILRK